MIVKQEDLSLDKRELYLKDIKLSLKRMVEKYNLSPLCFIDIDDFILEWFCGNRLRPFCISVVDDATCLKLSVDYTNQEKNIKGIVLFHGQGMWEYNFEIKNVDTSLVKSDIENIFNLSFKGEAYRWNKEIDESQCNHIFSFPNDLDKLLCVKEEFTKEPQKLFGINTGLRFYDNRVTAAWTLGFYDGPLSGFCYLNKKLHYFDLCEELTYSGQRLYSIYPLTFKEKLRAYTNHWIWQQSILGRKKLYNVLKHLSKSKKPYNSLPSIGGMKG